MPMTDDQQTIRYISERRCASGGYCFYRLDEPNAADTFYALASLALLDALPVDPPTLSYLQMFQRKDGSFANINVGHAICRSLLIVSERPDRDPVAWLRAEMVPPGTNERPVESVSLFSNLYLCTDLCMILGVPVPEDKRAEIVNAVLEYRHTSGGFGNGRPTLVETCHAVAILSALGCAEPLQQSTGFLETCGDPEFGFLAVPGVRPAFLEHVHAGLRAGSLVGGVRFPEACRNFIGRCRLDNGGYARSVFGGAATLENTYLALAARSFFETSIGSGSKKTGATDPLRCCD